MSDWRTILRRVAAWSAFALPMAVQAANVVSVAIEGPDTINGLVDRRVTYQARLYYDDGTNQLDTSVQWSTDAASSSVGKMLGGGTFAVFGPGVATLSVYYPYQYAYPAPVSASKTVAVQVGTPPSLPILMDCPDTEPAAGTDYVLHEFLVGVANDVVPLCGPQVLVANAGFNRVEVIDVAQGTVLRSWPLTAQPVRLRRVKGTPYVFATERSSFGARIDMSSDTVWTFAVPGTTQYGVLEGEPGEVWYATSSGMTRLSSSAPTQVLGQSNIFAMLAAYDARHHRLFVGDSGYSPTGLGRYDYSPASHAFTLVQSISDGSNGESVTVSPNGRHVAHPVGSGNRDYYTGTGGYTIWDMNAEDLNQHFGEWYTDAYPTDADFRFDSKKVLTTNDSKLAVWDVATHVGEVAWLGSGGSSLCYQGWITRVRWSPLGRNVFALADCDVYGSAQRILYVSVPAPTGLFVEKTGAGTARVTGSPGIIDCGDDCIDSFPLGTTVTLTATPDAGSTFDGWSGCDSVSGSQCTVTLAGARTVSVRLKGPQSITFAALSNRTFTAAPFTVAATSSSGLPVTFTSATPAVCTVAGTTVTLVGLGTCTLNADQAGDTNYNPAPQVSRSFAVMTTLSVGKTGGGTGRVTSSPGIVDCGNVCVDSFALGTTVTLTVTPDAGSGFDSWSGCDSVSGTQCTVTLAGARGVSVRLKAPQSITFAALANRKLGDSPFTLSATASSGLAVSFTSATPTVCTVSGATATIVAVGTCTLTASQAGDANYNAAAPVSRSFAVIGTNALPGISTRMQVLTGDNVLIGGFIIGGAAPKMVVVRARGPSLGVTGALADPVLTLVPADGSPPITNDNWGAAANAPQLAASGYQPGAASESAILVTLNPGAYTAIVRGAGGTTGVAIVEVFEMDHPEVPLTAISTRGRVDTGDNVLIGGFIIAGSTPQTVVVRARGPSLGVAGALVDPVLTLVPADGTPATTNDDWGTAANAAQLQASGFQPGSPKESALLVTLNPGAYTAIVTGAGGTRGIAIVEVFAQ